jgi:hypothetical protein
MAHTYTPGLRVAACATIRKKRTLPIQGNVLVKPGDKVTAYTTIARTELPGRVQSVNVVNVLSIPPEEIRMYMKKKEGDKVEKGETLAENKPLIKWFKTTVISPVGGKVENISEVTGQVLLREPPTPLELFAYVDSQVIEVFPREGALVECTASFVQGIFGIGGETNGELAFAVKTPDQELKPEHLDPRHRDKIIIGGSFAGMSFFKKAVELGVKGIVVGGVEARDIKELLGYDLGVAITGTESIGFTLIVTEGFGKIAMAKRTFDLLGTCVGKKASISGATQIRAGVIRPEIICPLSPEEMAKVSTLAEKERGGLQQGDQIRLIRDPFFGRIGVVKSLPHDLTKIPTESHVRVLEVEFPDGKVATIPRANVELIES